MIVLELGENLTIRHYSKPTPWVWKHRETNEEVSEEVGRADPKTYRETSSIRITTTPSEEVLNWCGENCQGEFSWDGPNITFFDDRDAVLFKMTFG